MGGNEILIFEENFIRRILKEDWWYYYVEDICKILSVYHQLNWNQLKEHLDKELLDYISENNLILSDKENIIREYIPREVIFRILDAIPECKKRARFKLWFHDITGAELSEFACANNKYIKQADEQLQQILSEEYFI